MSAGQGGDGGEAEVGRVALLAANARLVPVRIVSVDGARLRTLGRDGVVRVVAPARLYWLGDERVADLDGLNRYWQAVVKRARDCDLAMAWRLLTEDGGTEETTLTELAELTPGGHAPEDVDGLAVALFSDPLYFKLRRRRVKVASTERVEAEARRLEAEARAAHELEVAAGSLEARLDHEAEGRALTAADRAAVDRHVAALVDLAVFGVDAPEARTATALMERLGLPRRGDPVRRAFDLLVRLGEFEPDENLFVRRAGVRVDFPAAVLEEADRLATEPPDRGRARDMTGLLTVAIDDPRTTEVDDAFAIEGDRLHVFIADAAAFVTRGGAVEREALERASTLYLPRGKVPMLPSILGEDAASLREGEVRPALCFSAEIDDRGRLIALEVREATCRVDAHLSYPRVDEILAGDPADDAMYALIHRAAGWMDRHRDGRAARGALMLQRSEVDIAVAEDGTVSVTRVSANGPARRLVSEMMVAVGGATAQWCQENQVPCIYRAQPSPDDPIGWGDEGEIQGVADQVAVLRRLKPSTLTTHAKPHFTLGLGAYTQVTSPLRRYQDLLVHHQLKSVVRFRRPALSVGHLMQCFDHVERAAAQLRRVEADTRRYWMLRYLEQQPDRTWEATVVRELSRRWQVELDDLAFQTLFVAERPLIPGEALTLVVSEVDARRDHLVLTEV